MFLCTLDLFKSHEIDWTTFKTLTESDLREIGVTALGARRKILLSIAGEILYFSYNVLKPSIAKTLFALQYF